MVEVVPALYINIAGRTFSSAVSAHYRIALHHDGHLQHVSSAQA